MHNFNLTNNINNLKEKILFKIKEMATNNKLKHFNKFAHTVRTFYVL